MSRKKYQLIIKKDVSNRWNELLSPIRFRINSDKKANTDQNSLYSTGKQHANPHFVSGGIGVIPVIIIGRSGSMYIVHLYYIGNWGKTFISFPWVKSKSEYLDLLGTSHQMVEKLGSIFLHGKTPNLNFKDLIRVTDTVHHTCIKDYFSHYLSYLVRCREMKVIDAKLYKSSECTVDSKDALIWTLDSSDIEPNKLIEYLDYHLAVENMEPHKNLSADTLFRKIFEDAYSVNQYMADFEKSIEEFKKQDSILYKSTQLLLLDQKILFDDFSQKLNKEIRPLTKHLSASSLPKTQKSEVGESRALTKQVLVVARNLSNLLFTTILRILTSCWARFRDTLSRWWAKIKRKFNMK